MKKIMIFGTFDRVHPGHEFVLNNAQKQGAVTAIVARDENVLKIKGRLPVLSEEKRLQDLKARFPSATFLLGDPKDFLAPIRRLQPDLILLGYDQNLPPGVKEDDLGCKIERLAPFHPERYKSSLLS